MSKVKDLIQAREKINDLAFEMYQVVMSEQECLDYSMSDRTPEEKTSYLKGLSEILPAQRRELGKYLLGRMIGSFDAKIVPDVEREFGEIFGILGDDNLFFFVPIPNIGQTHLVCNMIDENEFGHDCSLVADNFRNYYLVCKVGKKKDVWEFVIKPVGREDLERVFSGETIADVFRGTMYAHYVQIRGRMIIIEYKYLEKELIAKYTPKVGSVDLEDKDIQTLIKAIM